MKRNDPTGHFSIAAVLPLAGILGFLAALAQVILIRVLMTAFSGNEFVFAVVLGAWLAGIAAGSAVTRSCDRRLALILLISCVLLLPLTVLGAMLLKPALGIPLGSIAPPGSVAVAAAGLLLPLTMALGASFAILAKAGRTDRAAVRVYGAEALGFVAGGLLMTFVFFVPLPCGVAQWAQQAAWPGYRVVTSRQTHYGQLSVVERGGQRSLFENGKHLFTAQDALAAEEVHAGLLIHPAPRRMFLIGGGMSQAGAEALKHPLQQLDYAELDPQALRLERDYIAEMRDPRLVVMAGDPRTSLDHAPNLYDVIAVNGGDPAALLTGRFFTREFFSLARRHLSRGGLVSVTISSSADSLNRQGMAYARSVMATLSAVFKDVRVIPGDKMTFIAGDHIPVLTADLLVRRLQERKIVTQFMRGYYLNDRMSPLRMDAVRDWMDGAREVGTDERPVTVERSFLFMTSGYGGVFSKIVEAVEGSPKFLWLLLPCALIVASMFYPCAVPFIGAGLMGFTQMVFQVAVIFAVQAFFGYAYAAVGLLTAGFMLGAFLGTRILSLIPLRWAVPAGPGLQALLAVLFIAGLGWPAFLWGFPVLAGVAAGIQFGLFTVMAGEGRAGKVYAADVIGAGAGALCAGLFLVPLWGFAATMALMAVISLLMYLRTCKSALP